MGEFGLKVASERKSVDSRDPKDFLLDSKLEVPKVDLTASFPRYGIINFHFLAQPPDGLESLIYILPHQLGYIPMHLIYGVDKDSFADTGMTLVYAAPVSLTNINFANVSRVTTKIDSTNLYFYVLGDISNGGTVGGRATLRYTIFSKPLV